MNNIFETPFGRLLYLAAVCGGSPPVERTATGNPLTFTTDIAKPLKSLLIPFTPVQSGTGDPSPENIRSILPWNGLTVFGGGKNLFDEANFEWSTTTTIEYVPIHVGNGIFTMSTDFPNNSAKDVFVLAGSVSSGASSDINGVSDTNPRTVTAIDGYITVATRYYDTRLRPSEYNWQIEAGSTATAYEPYKPITETDISFPSPVYGGEHEAVSGRLENGWWSLDVSWSARWYGQQFTNVERRVFRLPTGIIPKTDAYYNDHKEEILCNTAKWVWSFNDDSVHFYVSKDGGTYIAIVFLPIGTPEDTRIQIVGTLATPQEQTLTGHQITALKGDNTIWSDADGSMTAVYLVSEAYAEDHPVSGGLGSGLLGGGLGSGTCEPDEPGEPDQPDEPVEPDHPADDQPEES